MPTPAYSVLRPVHQASPVIFASPHSGSAYNAAFLARSVLDERQIRSSEDAFVDRLFDCAPEFGAVFLKAWAPRAFIDLNRSPDELDPAVIEGVERRGHNPRVASGLGVIPRVVANGRAIYRGKLSLAEAQARIDTYWRPYHRALRGLMEEAQARHGQAVLIDCHSMPHEAMNGVARYGMRRPDVVLGDRFGSSAGEDIVDQIETAFTGAGFVVARNTPFAGAFITQAYGRPSSGQHAVQIEIDRSLYMNEARIEPGVNFSDMQRTLRRVISELALIGQDQVPLAAE